MLASLGRGSVTAAAALLLAGSPAAAQRGGRYDATIVRTTYGVPHITARDHASLGYGVGYSAAEDNVCVLAEQLITVRGERAAFLGAGPAGQGASNVESDIYYRIVGDGDAMRRGFAAASPQARALVQGFAAGYNRYLRDQASRLPQPCAGQDWVRPMSVSDALLLMAGSLMPPVFLRQLANAAPPGEAPAGAAAVGVPALAEVAPRFGSNGWAFGREATSNGRGLLVGNPHYPWEGANRFRQMHLTIPGQLDVMGAGLVVTPFVAIGFNRDVAWTHTVTTAQHATVFELRLDPSDPTVYLVDGRRERMTRRTVTIPVRGAAPITRTLYSSRYGPIGVLAGANLNWTRERAYALRNANQNNSRSVDTWMDIARARSVRQIRAAIGRLGVPFTNTIAADRGGEALYADVTAVPYVTAEKVERCGVQAGRAPPLVAQRIYVLDGARSECNWDVDRSTPEPGLMPERMMPTLYRRDFVQNSNDSYWLSNPAAPLPAAAPVIGLTGTRPSFRTQSGILEIQRQLANGRRIDQESARQLILANRSMAAERLLDDLIAICTPDASLAAACQALRGWDRRADLDSRGALLFFGFLRHSAQIQDLYRRPFDPRDPVNTPSGLSPAASDGIRRALSAAATEMSTFGVALDAPLGQVQQVPREGGRIPIHGGPGNAGILNMVQSRVTMAGLEPAGGSSYIQVVSFDADGPVADAILTYSQSTDPRSPHASDQTRAFSEKRWNRLPFEPAEIQRAAIGQPLRIME